MIINLASALFLFATLPEVFGGRGGGLGCDLSDPPIPIPSTAGMCYLLDADNGADDDNDCN